jgi:chromosome segregation ATPase
VSDALLLRSNECIVELEKQTRDLAAELTMSSQSRNASPSQLHAKSPQQARADEKIANLESQNRNLQHQLTSLSEATAKLEVDHKEQEVQALRAELGDSKRRASELEQRLGQSEAAVPLRLQQLEAAHADEKRKLQLELTAQSAARAKQDVDHKEQLRALSMETEDVLRHASELEQRLRQAESAAPSRQLQQQEAAHADEKRNLEAVRTFLRFWLWSRCSAAQSASAAAVWGACRRCRRPSCASLIRKVGWLRPRRDCGERGKPQSSGSSIW